MFFVIEILKIRICFEFRYLDFGFIQEVTLKLG